MYIILTYLYKDNNEINIYTNRKVLREKNKWTQIIVH